VEISNVPVVLLVTVLESLIRKIPCVSEADPLFIHVVASKIFVVVPLRVLVPLVVNVLTPALMLPSVQLNAPLTLTAPEPEAPKVPPLIARLAKVVALVVLRVPLLSITGVEVPIVPETKVVFPSETWKVPSPVILEAFPSVRDPPEN
jgi:hypothetical protein